MPNSFALDQECPSKEEKTRTRLFYLSIISNRRHLAPDEFVRFRIGLDSCSVKLSVQLPLYARELLGQIVAPVNLLAKVHRVVGIRMEPVW